MGEIISKNCIFIDFDGVLFNTVKEAYVVTSIAMNKYKCIDDVVFDTDYFKYFLKYRYLVGPAWNYKYIWELLSLKKLNGFEQLYQNLVSNAQQSDYYKFENLFFSTREKIKLNEFDKWIGLNESYDFLRLIKHNLIKNNEFFIIVTTKDKATVKKLLNLEGIAMSDNSIYDKDDFEKFKNKSIIIDSIMKKRNIDKAIFVDDNLEHLNKCKKILNLETYEARWGYSASKKNIGFIEMNNVAVKINNLLGKIQCME
jgi:hypothetical protein